MAFDFNPNKLKREHKRWVSIAVVSIAALFLGFGVFATFLSQPFWKFILVGLLFLTVFWIHKNM